ncbi:unnamed protein product [Penicillium salamii]|uniref:BZIP domain-containing protein n=1 Tax=Penicillium salamii TaxID=1612424 RepID=A0A9W4JXU1_9EURO|nr:unnamed protein product [Penicillium salamii]CAG8028027.1 unnamed protein product [Penicillium salamii]CAG8063026.1 unnamed protein product [Penicillium salamii]CAG8080052.1 unnamed protein product [Penicillium salamii]CAG8187441.1 unnamed protein product [Penicillium salamii]
MAHQMNNPPVESSPPSPDQLDSVARRKLQNRLNQRARRKRKALEAENKNVSNKKWVVYTDESIVKPFTPPVQKPSQSNPYVTDISQQKDCKSICGIDTAGHDALSIEVYMRALYQLQNPTPTPGPSFRVTQYNLLIATFTNAKLMGLTFDLLTEDLASQFNLVGQSSLHLPPSLWPSKSQRKIIHHPWIDLIPILSLRESILSRIDTLDEDEACGDLYGMCSPPSSDTETGLRVWGEAWDPLAYEASGNLIKKWSWIAKECPDVMKSTNYWRRQRGEKGFVIGEE